MRLGWTGLGSQRPLPTIHPTNPTTMTAIASPKPATAITSTIPALTRRTPARTVLYPLAASGSRERIGAHLGMSQGVPPPSWVA